MRTKKGLALGIMTIAGFGTCSAVLLHDTEGEGSRRSFGEASGRRVPGATGLASPGGAKATRRGTKASPSSSLPRATQLALREAGLLHRGETSATGATALEATHGVATLSSSRRVAGEARGVESADELAAADKDRRERALQALAKVDWTSTLRDLVAGLKAAKAEKKNPDVNGFIEVAQINVALGEAAKALGLATPAQALSDPTVRSAVVPGWLKALGVDLAPDQAATVAAACLALPSPDASASGTFLDARQAAVQSRLALEQAIGQVLTPQQMSAYYSGLPDDPLMRTIAPQMNFSAATPDALARAAATYWANTFKLGPTSQETAQQVAAQYVASVLATPPVAPNLDTAAARAASLDHMSQLVALQKQAEQALAASPGLTEAERSRATNGSNCCLKLNLSSSTARSK